MKLKFSAIFIDRSEACPAYFIFKDTGKILFTFSRYKFILTEYPSNGKI